MDQISKAEPGFELVSPHSHCNLTSTMSVAEIRGTHRYCVLAEAVSQTQVTRYTALTRHVHGLEPKESC